MKKKPATKRRRHPELALKIARAQLRAIRQTVSHMKPIGGESAITANLGVYDGIDRASNGPARFIQCWTVTRGYSGVTQALDNAGQVWERVSLMEDVIDDDGKKGKRLKDSWWVPLSMQRREA